MERQADQAFNFADRGWPRQEGHHHLRPGSFSPGLPQGPAAVCRISSIGNTCARTTLLTIHHSLTRELEKKFSDRHVIFLASRRILPKPKRSNRSRTTQTQKRPRSRTLTAVHEAVLADIVYPVEIVGKRLRTKEDGAKVMKVILDEKEKGGVDHRLDAYSEVYRKLTGRGVSFEFPQSGSAEY